MSLILTMTFVLILLTLSSGQSIGECDSNQFQCQTSKACIPFQEKCDFVNQCGDSSDETSCVYCDKARKLYAHCIRTESNQIMTVHGGIFINNYGVGKPIAEIPIRDASYFQAVCSKVDQITSCIDNHNGKECDKKEMSLLSLSFLKLYLPKICSRTEEYQSLYKCLREADSNPAERKTFFESCRKKNLELKNLQAPTLKNCADVPALKETIKCAAQTVVKFDSKCGNEVDVAKTLYDLDYAIDLMKCSEEDGDKDGGDKDGGDKEEGGDKEGENKDVTTKGEDPKVGLSGGKRVDGGIVMVTISVLFIVLFHMSE